MIPHGGLGACPMPLTSLPGVDMCGRPAIAMPVPGWARKGCGAANIERRFGPRFSAPPPSSTGSLSGAMRPLSPNTLPARSLTASASRGLWNLTRHSPQSRSNRRRDRCAGGGLRDCRRARSVRRSLAPDAGETMPVADEKARHLQSTMLRPADRRPAAMATTLRPQHSVLTPRSDRAALLKSGGSCRASVRVLPASALSSRTAYFACRRRRSRQV